MSVYRRFPTENMPSFITTNTYERRRVFSSPQACDLLVDTLYDVLSETQTQLLAFAIMPDHLHAIVVAGLAGLPKAVQLIKGRFSRAHNLGAHTSGPVWQGRYHERTLLTEAALFAAIEYVHLNPVNADLAQTPEDYPFSSANARFQTHLEEYLGA